MRIAKNHSATHLLQKALRVVLGTHVEQAGSDVDDQRLRFDFTHFSALTEEQIREVEQLVNLQIAADLPVVTEIMSLEDAKKSGAMAKNEWIIYKGRQYYMNARGFIARNTWVGDYYVGSNGLKKRNCWVGRQYLDAAGLRAENATEKTVRSTAADKDIKKGSKLIIVGASRVVQMGVAVTGDEAATYIARYGAGYSWFSGTGMTALTAYLRVYPKSKVVIQLGNNDLGNFSRYEALYRNLIKEYPDASFYFMDALPSANKSKNAQRQAFNAKLKAAFPSQYIGGYDYMARMKVGYRSKKDKEHYNKATYRKIYKYIVSKIR
jgi:hypothetical protein